jgi:alkylation response protein AidB-like acyl-CoA dehydrogenase
MTPSLLALPEVLTVLAEHAEAVNDAPVWPAPSWRALRDSGVLGWCIPAEYGGSGLAGPALLEGYEQLAAACLTTCFILSQRDSACRRLLEGTSVELRHEILPLLASGEAFATVGLSQLTTSHQHGAPAFVAETVANGFMLDGTIPWVTGADKADYLAIGAVLREGGQILAVLPRNLPGVTVDPPLKLMALEGSLTAQVRCRRVFLESRWLLAGPAERVMASGRSGTGGLETSCLALGLAGAAVDYLQIEAKARPELRASTERLEHTRQELRQEMFRLAGSSCPPAEAMALRARANGLVLRASQAALTAGKGTGFLRSHPTQRWVRQALFFLVWSCPRPAADATLAFLTGSICSS